MGASPSRSEFEGFVARVESRLRIALTAVFGRDDGRDAAAAALAYAWEDWTGCRRWTSRPDTFYSVGRLSQGLDFLDSIRGRARDASRAAV